tara:strand:+ start:561 stop:857 length:297 start_codon:yes stop_codon:yes gene_type:complete
MGRVRGIVKAIKGKDKIGGGVKKPKSPAAAERRRKLMADARNKNPAKPKTFESEKREIMGKRMNDRQRQSAMINLAVKYGRPIKIAGMTLGPKKNKAK